MKTGTKILIIFFAFVPLWAASNALLYLHGVGPDWIGDMQMWWWGAFIWTAFQLLREETP